MTKDYRLQRLRVPTGWQINWNKLYEGSEPESGELGGSSLFAAVNENQRFSIDVEFRPEFDPTGHFRMSIIYQPWARTPSGKRQANAPLVFGSDAEDVHCFTTRSFEDLVDQLEYWLERCAGWTREGH